MRGFTVEIGARKVSSARAGGENGHAQWSQNLREGR